ncbi:hypothetical protein D3C85_1120240 [compost metagenome]
MEHEMEQAIRVGIHFTKESTLRQVYFRAGLPIAPGKSEMAVSPLQCETLEADPRLVVMRLAKDALLSAGDAPSPDGDLDPALGDLSQGMATADGRAIPLAEMKVDELRALAVEMAIPDAAGMKKAELLAAIVATQVQQPVAAPGAESNQQGGE